MRHRQTESVVAVNPQFIGSGSWEFEISDYLFRKVRRAAARKRISRGKVVHGVSPIDHCGHSKVSVGIGTAKVGGVRAVQASELVFGPSQVACRRRISLIRPCEEAGELVFTEPAGMA